MVLACTLNCNCRPYVTTAVQLCPEGCSAVSVPREGRIGGGITVVYRSDITLKSKSVYNYQSMECADFLLASQNMLVNLCVIYRPPDTCIAAFWDDLTDYCERNITSPGRMVIVRDVNIHTDKEPHPDAVLLCETLGGLGLKNHVDFVTHHLGNSLDAVMSFQDDSIVNTVVQGELFSDHHWVFFNISRSSSMHQVDEIAYRKIKLISTDAFAGDISRELDWLDADKLDLEPCLALYNSTLMSILDQHTPIKKKSVPNWKGVPWITKAIRDEIRKCRWMEHIWRHDRENLDRYQDFCSQCRLVSNLLFATEKEYYHANFHEHSGNIKQVFKLCNCLLGWKKEQSFPPGLNNQELADTFNKFFITKITNISSNLLEQDTWKSVTQPGNCLIPNALMKFWPLSCEDVSKIVLSSPAKTCNADPILTGLLKSVQPAIIHHLTKLVNESLQTGKFPDDLKQALVTPLLKKPSLDLILKNYRPISNLPFVEMLLERCVIDQLLEHIHTNNLMEPLQSVYRSHHSSDTALLKVKTDILKAMDNQEVTCLVLLDFSVAFDTVDHKILLDRLENYFGITRIALRWIKSYLTNQSQRVIIGDANMTGAKSSNISLECGVPQGSALGPISFTLYTSLLSQICSSKVHYHLYADDQQLYLSFKPGPTGVQLAQDDCIHRMEGCVEQIKNGWPVTCWSSMRKKQNLSFSEPINNWKNFKTSLLG